MATLLTRLGRRLAGPLAAATGLGTVAAGLSITGSPLSTTTPSFTSCSPSSSSSSSSSSTWPTSAFLREIPKTDLHVHLDGSLRLDTLIALAADMGLSLPAQTEAGLRKLVFKETYSSLVEYLAGFAYTSAVMRTPENQERVAYEFAVDNYEEGVYYFEVRFAPQLHCSENMNIEQVLHAVNRGLRRARDEFNVKDERSSRSSPFASPASGSSSSPSSLPPPPRREYGIIVCALRMFGDWASPYYKAFCEAHKHEPQERVVGLASYALVASTVAAIEAAEAAAGPEEGTPFTLPVVALDIAGAEAGYEAMWHKEAFDAAHKKRLSATVHAAEAFGPESLNQAVTCLHADRIGHGFHLFSDDLVQDPKNGGEGKDEGGASSSSSSSSSSSAGSRKQRADYVENLVRYVDQRGVAFEVCPTSNLHTMPELAAKGLGAHAAKRMIEENLDVTINTDNRLVSRTDTVKELGSVIDAFALSPAQVRRVVKCGFERSFFPGTHLEKQQYVAQAMRYYDAVAARHGVGSGGSGTGET